MEEPYFKQIFLAYLLVFAISSFFVPKTQLLAKGLVEKDSKIYELEVNSSDYNEIKEAIISKDVKYVVFPNALENDVKLSEVTAGNIDFLDYNVQEVEFEVARYTNSKSNKIKIDVIKEVIHIKYVDTIAPTIALSESSVKLVEGDDFDPNTYLDSVIDNSYDEIEVDIEDNVDASEPGTYDVVYKATDSSGNTSDEVLSVTVTEKPKPKPKPVVKPAATPRVAVAASGSNVYDTLNIINQHRANLGLHPLQMGGGAEMQALAIRASEASSYLSHYRPDGRHYKTAFTDQGVSHSNPLEVLTYSGSTPAAKVAWWMSSPTHRATIMSSSATHIAIGVSGNLYAAIVYR